MSLTFAAFLKRNRKPPEANRTGPWPSRRNSTQCRPSCFSLTAFWTWAGDLPFWRAVWVISAPKQVTYTVSHSQTVPSCCGFHSSRHSARCFSVFPFQQKHCLKSRWTSPATSCTIPSYAFVSSFAKPYPTVDGRGARERYGFLGPSG